MTIWLKIPGNILLLTVLLPLFHSEIRANERFSNSDPVIMKQFYVHHSERDKPEGSDGVITFLFFSSNLDQLNAELFEYGISAGTIKSEEIEFNPELMHRSSMRKLEVPFTFSEKSDTDYQRVHIQLNGREYYLDLYEGFNHTVTVRKGDAGRDFEVLPLAYKRNINPPVLHSGFYINPGVYHPVHLPQRDDRSAPRSAFLYRNRYWVLGATSLVIGGTTAVISSSGSGAAFLPDPPGRP